MTGGDEFAETTMQRMDFVVSLAKTLLNASGDVFLLHPFFVTVSVEHAIRHFFVVTLHFTGRYWIRSNWYFR